MTVCDPRKEEINNWISFADKKFFKEFVIFKELIDFFNEFYGVLWNFAFDGNYFKSHKYCIDIICLFL